MNTPVHLIVGPRQVGKSTLCDHYLYIQIASSLQF